MAEHLPFKQGVRSSNLRWVTTKKDTTYVVSFFVDFAARWAASPFRIKMLGMAKPFLRRGFACGKTLERRKSGAALKGRWARFKTVRPKFEISRLQ